MNEDERKRKEGRRVGREGVEGRKEREGEELRSGDRRGRRKDEKKKGIGRGKRKKKKERKGKAEKMRGLGVEEGKKGETRREGMSMRGGRTREIKQCEKSEDLDQRERKERE